GRARHPSRSSAAGRSHAVARGRNPRIYARDDDEEAQGPQARAPPERSAEHDRDPRAPRNLPPDLDGDGARGLDHPGRPVRGGNRFRMSVAGATSFFTLPATPERTECGAARVLGATVAGTSEAPSEASAFSDENVVAGGVAPAQVARGEAAGTTSPFFRVMTT